MFIYADTMGYWFGDRKNPVQRVWVDNPSGEGWDATAQAIASINLNEKVLPEGILVDGSPEELQVVRSALPGGHNVVLGPDLFVQKIITSGFRNRWFPKEGLGVVWVGFKRTRLFFFSNRKSPSREFGAGEGVVCLLEKCISRFGSEDESPARSYVFKSLLEGGSIVDFFETAVDCHEVLGQFFKETREKIVAVLEGEFSDNGAPVSQNVPLFFTGPGAGIFKKWNRFSDQFFSLIQENFLPESAIRVYLREVDCGNSLLKKREKTSQNRRTFVFQNERVLAFIDGLSYKKRAETIEQILAEYIENNPN